MFIQEINSSTSMKLDDDIRPHVEQMRHCLHLLDGERFFAYSIFYVPDDAGWPDCSKGDEELYEKSYLQSAGNREAMVIEVRRLEGDGQYHQYEVGRAVPAGSSELVDVHYSASTLTVPRSEVFAADEAAPIYHHYFRTQTLPEGLSLRELDFS